MGKLESLLAVALGGVLVVPLLVGLRGDDGEAKVVKKVVLCEERSTHADFIPPFDYDAAVYHVQRYWHVTAADETWTKVYAETSPTVGQTCRSADWRR